VSPVRTSRPTQQSEDPVVIVQPPASEISDAEYPVPQPVLDFEAEHYPELPEEEPA